MRNCSNKQLVASINKVLCLLSKDKEVYERALQMANAMLCDKKTSHRSKSHRSKSHRSKSHRSKSHRSKSHRLDPRLVKSYGGNKNVILVILLFILTSLHYTLSLVHVPPSAFKFEDMKGAIDLNNTRLMLDVLDNSEVGQCTWLSRMATSVETADTLGERIRALDRQNIKDEIRIKPPNKRKLHRPLTTSIDSYAPMKEVGVSYPTSWEDVQPLIDAQARTLYYPEGKTHDESKILLHTLGVILPSARHAFIGLSRMNGGKVEYGVMDSGVDFDIKTASGELEAGMTMRYKKWLYVTPGLFGADKPENCTVTENPVYSFLNDRFLDVAFAMDTSPIPYEGVIFHLEGNTTSATPYSKSLPIVTKSTELLRNLKELHATTVAAVDAYISELSETEGETCINNTCSKKHGGSGTRKRNKIVT
jgi:hypothetical protein